MRASTAVGLAVALLGVSLVAYRLEVPDAHIVKLITDLAGQALAKLGYGGVVGLMTLESAAIPVPSEVVVPLAAIYFRGQLGLLGVVAASTLGNLMGSLALYYASALGGRGLALKLMGEADFRRAEAFFKDRGELAVLAGRVLPAVRSYISAPPGIFRMGLARFIAYTLAGSVTWNSLLAWLGHAYGQEVLSLPWIDVAGGLGLVALGAAVAMLPGRQANASRPSRHAAQ